MGQAIAGRLAEQRDLELAGIWTRDADLDALLEDADVLIDFSLPAGTEAVLDAVDRHPLPVVCGVSGLNDAQLRKLESTAAMVPLVYDRNMSLGVAVLERAVRDAAAALGTDFKVVIAETHHVHKKDAPSGTALKLGEAVAGTRGDLDAGDIHYEVERVGEVPGDHEVVFRSNNERLSFAHSVTSRDVFADGALHAARWVIGRAAGLYRMSDVLIGEERH
jgi:4-hydroxy-tetrahydrodipicolinate reductase